MPRFAANLTMMFPELSFMARFEAASEAGFDGVEFLFPYAFDPHAIRAELDRLDLTQVVINAPPGDFDNGERGLAALSGREGEFQASIERALNFAEIIRPERLHVMAGVAEGPAAEQVYIDNLSYAATRAAERSPELTLTIEAINTRDMPGYFVNFTDHALSMLDAVAAPNLKLQFDFYHCQIMEGDLTKHLEAFASRIDHIQIAGVPDRCEPDAGEVNFPHLFDRLDALGYQGWVGCGYRPRRKTVDGLGWFEPYRRR